MYYLVVLGCSRQAAIQVSTGAVVFSDAHLGKEPLSSSLCWQNSSPLGGRVTSQFSCWTLVRSCSLYLKPAQGSFPSSQILSQDMEVYFFKANSGESPQSSLRRLHLTQQNIIAEGTSISLPIFYWPEASHRSIPHSKGRDYAGCEHGRQKSRALCCLQQVRSRLCSHLLDQRIVFCAY